jgi:hypothetical protein
MFIPSLPFTPQSTPKTTALEHPNPSKNLTFSLIDRHAFRCSIFFCFSIGNRMICQVPTFKIHRKNNGFWRNFEIQFFRKRPPKWSCLNPKFNQQSPKNIKKTCSENASFFDVDFLRFLEDLDPQNHPEMRSGTPPSLPRALLECLLNAPCAKKTSQTRFLMAWVGFWMTFGWIWTPKRVPKCFQNNKICFTTSHILSSSSKTSATLSRQLLMILNRIYHVPNTKWSIEPTKDFPVLPASGLLSASAGHAKR